MSVRTLFDYLIGKETAIREIASNRSSLWVGFLLCFCAALARHYDGKYLVREPWFLLLPAGASLLTSLIVFSVFYLATSIKAREVLPGLGRAFLSFLGLYWMTAPLALLYGVPYERFLSEVHAAQANVWTLELVSVWRVLLISRVAAVLTPSSFFSAFTKIAVPAFALFYIRLTYAHMPLIGFMGGVQMPPSVEPLASAYLFVTLFGFFALVLGGCVWAGMLFGENPDSDLRGFLDRSDATVDKSVLVFVFVIVFGFALALPFTQKEQRLRYEVEKKLSHNDIDGALDILASHQRREFPPQWNLPPRPEYGEGTKNPNLPDILHALKTRNDVPAWVHAAYEEKMQRYRQSAGE